jgi:tetratricopeptide (TPR) repeat protein
MRAKFTRFAFIGFLVACVAFSAFAQQVSETDRASAKSYVATGVEAFKNGQFDAAVAAFQQAKQSDPTSIIARLYLGTAYAAQYIPGAPSDDNRTFARHAIEEYKGVLERDPNNLTAIDGIGSILFGMGGNPFDIDAMNESKTYHERHVELRPNDPEPYYWIGVIDWSICYRAEQRLRDEWSDEHPNGNLAPAAPLPDAVRQDFANKCESTVNEGIVHGKKAIELKPDYEDAMAYLNLLYRLKADMEQEEDARDEDLRVAEQLVDQVKAIKEKRAAPPNQY